MVTPDALVTDLDASVEALALTVGEVPEPELVARLLNRWRLLQKHLGDGGDLPYVWAKARPERALTADEAVSVTARAGVAG